jgi:hypothetical protein
LLEAGVAGMENSKQPGSKLSVKNVASTTDNSSDSLQ